MKVTCVDPHGRPVQELRGPERWRDLDRWLAWRRIERELELAREQPGLVGAQTSPGYCVTSGTAAQALAAATRETTVNLIAGAAVGIHIIEFGISFDGVTASAVPVNVELCQSTQATAGTVGSSPTPVQIRGKTTTVGVTAGAAYTAEPTVLTPVKQWLVSPNGGLLVVQAPLGREMESDLSGGTIKAVALAATAPAIVNTRAYIEFERM
jgi:hypothetical protein